MLNWLKLKTQGKRTYLVALLMAGVTVGLVMFRHLSPTAAAAVFLLGASAFGATYRAALQRHHDELIAVLGDAALLGAALAGKQVPIAVQAAEAAYQDGSQLAASVCAETGQEKGQ